MAIHPLGFSGFIQYWSLLHLVCTQSLERCRINLTRISLFETLFSWERDRVSLLRKKFVSINCYGLCKGGNISKVRKKLVQPSTRNRYWLEDLKKAGKNFIKPIFRNDQSNIFSFFLWNLCSCLSKDSIVHTTCPCCFWPDWHSYLEKTLVKKILREKSLRSSGKKRIKKLHLMT